MEFNICDFDKDFISELFEGQEKLAMKYTLDMKYAQTGGGNSFEKTLMKLKYEMVQLLRCDVQLYKQLTDLSEAVQQLKEDIKTQDTIRPRFNSFTTTSSSTDGSFVSATEELDVPSSKVHDKEAYPRDFEDRVKSWINSNYQYTNSLVTDGEITDNVNLGFQQSNSNFKKCPSRQQKDGDNLCCNLLRGQFQSKCRYNGVTLMYDFRNSVDKNIPFANKVSEYKVTHDKPKSQYRKMFESTEFQPDEILTSYKSSLRLLGSIRMQSRMFESIHSKYRPFSLFGTIENFVSCTKPFLNIQPRPKLRRQTKILDPLEIDISKHSTLILTPATRDRADSEGKELYKNNELPNASDVDLSNDHVTSVDEEKDETTENDLAKELEESLVRADSGFSEDSEIHSDSELCENESENEIETYLPEFLHVNEGLITCRIMSPGLEKELESKQLEYDDFEFLVFVDGKVSFVPHILETDNEESFYLAWIFEEDQKLPKGVGFENELDNAETDSWNLSEPQGILQSLYAENVGKHSAMAREGIQLTAHEDDSNFSLEMGSEATTSDFVLDRTVRSVIAKHSRDWSMDSGLEEDFSE